MVAHVSMCNWHNAVLMAGAQALLVNEHTEMMLPLTVSLP